MPKVSVCIPVYNGARFLTQAVQSVLDQSFRDFEVLVFDDASTDGSWEVLNTFSDPRLRLRRNTRNLGPKANWDQCLEAARGRYTKLFHQDDLLRTDCLAKQVELLDRHSEAVLTFSKRTIIDPLGRRLWSRGGHWIPNAIRREDIIRGCLRAGTNVVGEPSAVLFRTDAASQAGRFDDDLPYLIDLDYWLRLLELGTAYYLDTELASFRVSKQQWSSVLAGHHSRQFMAFVAKLKTSGNCRISHSEQLLAGLMARKNEVLRTLFYRIRVKEL